MTPCNSLCKLSVILWVGVLKRGVHQINEHDCQEKFNRKAIKKPIPEIIAFLAFHVLSHNNFGYYGDYDSKNLPKALSSKSISMKEIQQKQWVKKPQAEYLHQILGDLLAISLF